MYQVAATEHVTDVNNSACNRNDIILSVTVQKFIL